MTTLIHPSDADVRPDVRAEAHAHRHPAKGLGLRSPLWLLFLLLFLSVGGSGLFVVAWNLGAAAYTTPQPI